MNRFVIQKRVHAMKKICTWMLCICLLSTIPLSAHAANDLLDIPTDISTKATFTIDTVEEADLVKVNISLAEKNTYIGAAQFDFDYDETYLEIVKSPYNGQFFTVINDLDTEYSVWAGNEKNMKIGLSHAYGLKDSGVFITVYFRVIRDIPENEIAEITGTFDLYPITAVIGQTIDYDATIINGGVVGTAAAPGNKHFAEQDTGIEAIVPSKDSVQDVEFVTQELEQTSKHTAYDICFKDGETEVQPDGNVVVRIPVPEGYNGSACHVYRTESDGSKTDMLAACHGDYLTFETNHFSEYLVTEEELPSTPIQLPLITPELLYGDINEDGNINAADALQALQHSVRLIELTGDAATAGDVEPDGKIDSTDALLILQHSVQLIESFPVEKTEGFSS